MELQLSEANYEAIFIRTSHDHRYAHALSSIVYVSEIKQQQLSVEGPQTSTSIQSTDKRKPRGVLKKPFCDSW